MGVPSFFKWLSSAYPEIVVPCVEELEASSGGSGPQPPADFSLPNPNGFEVSNLYMDMNGLIHPASHPEDAPAPANEAEMHVVLFGMLDRIMAIVRPRKVLYLAIDGVAPRAKINQQRSRRFRAAKEAEEKIREANALKKEWKEKGLKVEKIADSSEWNDDIPEALAKDKVEEGDVFDSNVITPGTPFMVRLSEALKAYVANRMATGPGWKDLRVIFSDSSVPGEGEHKIAEYIRVERCMAGYDPNLYHVLYGLDADLIMLALATHEVHFSILREEVFPKGGGGGFGSGGHGGRGGRGGRGGGRDGGGRGGGPKAPMQIDTLMAQAANARGAAATRAELGGKKPYEFLHINVLREYLDLEFRHDIEREIAAAIAKPSPGDPEGMAYDLERVIDDFVFLCFFVGNDFLPHLPTLDIREGAVDYLMEVYKTDVAHVGYLTSGAGDVDFTRAKKMLSRIGTKEDEVFRERSEKDRKFLMREMENRKAAALHKERQKLSADIEAKEVKSKKKTKKKKNGAVIPERVIPPPEELVALGEKVPTRVGDGSKNREVADKIKRGILAQRKKGKVKSASGSGSGVGSDVALGVASPTIAKSPPAVSAVALVVAKSGKSGESSPDGSKGKMEVASSNGEKGSGDDDDESPVTEEKTAEEFEKELKERLDSQKRIENPTDNVRLGEDGWKDRYYRHKFDWGPEDSKVKAILFHRYLEGLFWVMKYYYAGCVSWSWFYPYHYAPFASDIVFSSTESDTIELEEGAPYHPFTQLQSVMPACSGKLVLPECYWTLMTDPNSPIIDYYPDDFEIDLNGKKFLWQGVALLPFIDEERLAAALNGLDSKLTDEEKKRNSFGCGYVIAHAQSSLGKWAIGVESELKDGESVEVDKQVAEGQLFGQISNCEPLGESGDVIIAQFNIPEAQQHSTALLSGANAGPEVLTDVLKADCAENGGWKPAKFGSLGRAARELREKRDYRLGGGRGRPTRGGRGRGGGCNRGSHQYGRGGASYYQSQAPIIHAPVHPAASSMFGGLGGGTQAANQPAWMAQSGASYQGQFAGAAQYQQGYQQGYQQPQQHSLQRHYQQQQPQYAQQYQQPPLYQQGYGGQAVYGFGFQGGNAGQYGAGTAGQGGTPAQGVTPQQMPGQPGMQQPVGGNMQQQQYSFSANPQYYSQTYNTSGGGAGLAGPTAMQMRRAANSYTPSQQAGGMWTGQAYSTAPTAGVSMNQSMGAGDRGGRGRGSHGRGRGARGRNNS